MPTVKRHKHKRTDKALHRLKTGAPKAINRKVIYAGVDEGREYRLHATKGYRSDRA